MGQRTSTQRVFGYFSSDSQDPVQEHHQELQRQNDRMLSRPEDFGFDPTDSLENDLADIDATYYSGDDYKGKGPVVSQTLLNTQQQQLLFGDIKHLIDDDHKLQLQSRALVRLDNDILYLKTVTKLDLSRNHLTHLPDALGSLSQLTQLCLSHNRLAKLPDTLHRLAALTELDLSYNPPLVCGSITPYIGHLKKLTVLDLSHNPALAELPIELGGLDSLSILYVHKCPKLRAVPAELLRLPNLRRIKIDKITAGHTVHDLRHDPPSLVELCARAAYSTDVYAATSMSDWMASALPRPKPCTACGKPYLSSYVSRQRLEERGDGTLVMYEYRLCSEHWCDNDEDDRKRYMFSTSLPVDHDVLKFLPLPTTRPVTTTTAAAAALSAHTMLQQNDNVVVVINDDACNKKKWKRWLRPVRLEHHPTAFSSL